MLYLLTCLLALALWTIRRLQLRKSQLALDLTQLRSMQHALESANQELEGNLRLREQDLSKRERKLASAEQSAQENQRRMHRIIDAAYDAFVVFDTRGRITTFSTRAADLFGVRSEEAVGKSIRTFLEYDHLIKDLSEGRPKDATNVASCGVVESIAKNVNGKSIPVEVSLSMSRFDGRPEFHAFIHDLTPRNEMQSRLMHLEKMESLGKLSAGLAHEINTPIQFIGNNLEFLNSCIQDLTPLLRDVLGLAEEIAPQFPTRSQELSQRFAVIDLDFLVANLPQAIDSTIIGIKKIARITSAMKEFANPGFSTRAIACVDQLIEDVVLVSQHAWEPNADLELDLHTNTQTVECQPAELSQVFLSLISNACDTIREKIDQGLSQRGKITIRTRTEENSVLIEFEDTGMGIAKDIRKHIYDPFFTTRDVGKGMGQGLTVAHAVIVEKHHGKISFQTEELKGTCFTISLPLSVANRTLELANRELANR